MAGTSGSGMQVTMISRPRPSAWLLHNQAKVGRIAHPRGQMGQPGGIGEERSKQLGVYVEQFDLKRNGKVVRGRGN